MFLMQRDDIKTTLKKVAQNELDLAFVHYHALQETLVENDLKRLQLEFHKIYSDALSVCVRENHPLTWQERVTFADVMRYERVTMNPTKDFLMAQHFGARERDMSIVVLTDVLNLRKYGNADRRGGFSAAR